MNSSFIKIKISQFMKKVIKTFESYELILTNISKGVANLTTLER